MLRASAVLLVLAAVLAVAASTANAVVEPPIWQPAAVYLTIYDNDKCDSSKILVQRNVTTFGSCIRVGTYNSIRVDRDLLQPSSTLSTGYYSSTYCSSTSSSGDVALNGTCTKLSNGRSAQFETTFMIAPVTTYSNCDYDGIWLQPGSYSDLSVRRMTVENITIDNDASGATMLASTVYWSTLHNGVCAFAPNDTNVFMTVDFEADVDSSSVKYPKREDFALRASKTTINLVGGHSDYTQSVAGKVANLLTDECSCDAKIEVGGGPTTVYASSCKPPLPDTFWLCWLMSGSPLYIQASPVDEADGTWQHSYLNDSLRHRESTHQLQLGPFEQTTNNDQDKCDFDLWNSCEPLVKEAVRTCETNTDAPWNDLCVIQVMGQHGLDMCCPCAVRYTNQKDLPWLSRRCYPRY